MTESPTFDDGVISAVTRHMNADHPEDTLMICRTLGERPDAVAARMVGLDEFAGSYAVTVGDRTETISIPWSHRLQERAEIRTEVAAMYTEACISLGIEPRPH